jgi:acyl carrier protein
MTPELVSAGNAKHEIREKVFELAKRQGSAAPALGDAERIPETGLLDSASIMELIVWYESRFGLSIDPADLTMENFGSIDAMADFARRHGRH